MLDYCFNQSVVKSQEFFDCVTFISYTPVGNRMAWNWIQLHWEIVVDRFVYYSVKIKDFLLIAWLIDSVGMA